MLILKKFHNYKKMAAVLKLKKMHVLKDLIVNFLKRSLIREKRDKMKLPNKLTVSSKDLP